MLWCAVYFIEPVLDCVIGYCATLLPVLPWQLTWQVSAYLTGVSSFKTLSRLLMRQWLWILILLLLHKQKKTSSTLCSRLHSGHSLSFMCETCGWSQEISSCARRTHRKCDCDCRMKIAASVTRRRTRASSHHVFTDTETIQMHNMMALTCVL